MEYSGALCFAWIQIMSLLVSIGLSSSKGSPLPNSLSNTVYGSALPCQSRRRTGDLLIHGTVYIYLPVDLHHTEVGTAEALYHFSLSRDGSLYAGILTKEVMLGSTYSIESNQSFIGEPRDMIFSPDGGLLLGCTGRVADLWLCPSQLGTWESSTRIEYSPLSTESLLYHAGQQSHCILYWWYCQRR